MILYSNDCPQCKILQSKLDAKKINYTKINDMEKVVEMGFMSVPILVVDNKALSYLDAIGYVNNLKGD